MFVFNLIVFLVLIFAVAVIAISFVKIRSYRQKNRSTAIDLYKLRSEFSIKKEIIDLYKLVFGSLQTTIRKSPVLAAAEEFKRKFKLGRFIIFCTDRNMFLPLMGIGFKLRSIKPIKIDQLKHIIADANPGVSLKNGNSIGVPLKKSSYKPIAKLANLPFELNDPLIFHFSFKGQQILFMGEDAENELARNCTVSDFNKAVWPLITEICRSNNTSKKQLEKSRSLQSELRKVNDEIVDLSRRLKDKMIDIHSFFEISNRMFTIYDESRLIELFVDSIKTLLTPVSVVIMTRSEKNKNVYNVTISEGEHSSENHELELTSDSDIYKLLVSNNQAVSLPLLSSGLPETDDFIETALSNRLSILEKLQTSEKVYGFVLIGQKQGKDSYNDTDLEIFSTLSNLASLALGNINQYLLIEKMSYTDSMTELYNYRYFYKRLNEEIFRGKRFNRMLALVIFDIDNFKLFNDTYGHQAGDEVLKNMAELVTSSVRAIDIVSRYGGEEFCVIMPDTGFANCLIFIERLRKRIEGYAFLSKFVEKGYNITISIGGAVYPVDAQSADRLIYCADMALLKAKADGRNQSIMFNSAMLEDEELRKNSQQQLTDLGIYEDF